MKTIHETECDIDELKGKTIEEAWFGSIDEKYDDMPCLYLKMTDGTIFQIVSFYGDNNKEEYPCHISVHRYDKTIKIHFIEDVHGMLNDLTSDQLKKFEMSVRRGSL